MTGGIPYTHSEDGLHVAQKLGGPKRAMAIDGQRGQDFDDVKDPTFSLDGEHFAYIAVDGDKWLVVFDGQPGPRWSCVKSLAVSTRGEHVAYAASKGDTWYAVLDGHSGRGFKDVQYVTLSAEGGHVAYAAKRWGAGDISFHTKGRQASIEVSGEWTVVRDSQAEPWYYSVVYPTLSPDGSRLAYVVEDISLSGFMVVDGQPGQTRGYLKAPIFSSDGKHVAYEARVGDSWYVVLDGQPGPAYGSIRGLTFSPDGKRSAYMGYSKTYPYDGVVVVDGQPGPKYGKVWELTFSPDGKHIAYRADQGELAFAVLDGEPGLGYESVWEGLVFSPDGRLTYTARKDGKVFVVIGRQPGPAYGGEEITFSPDGRRIAFQTTVVGSGGWSERKKSVVLDGQLGPEYEGIVEGGPTFQSDGSLEYLAIRSESLYRVKHWQE
jgi:WD40 repeat protein